MSDKEKSVKQSFSKRVAGWGQKRVRHPFMGQLSRDIVKEGGRSALAGIKPQPLDPDELRKGFQGRYADGGVSRFEEMVSNLSLDEDDLHILGSFHSLQRLLNAFAGVLSMTLGFAMMSFGDISLTRFGGVAFLVFALVFLAGTLRHDFAMWQLKNRRMAGLSSYLSERFS